MQGAGSRKSLPPSRFGSPWVALDHTAEPPLLSLLSQACGGSRAQRAVYLLLALFREVSTLYRARSARLHPKPEVSAGLRGRGLSGKEVFTRLTWRGCFLCYPKLLEL